MDKVLIADDDESIRKVVSATLQNDSIEIIEAADGNEALSLAVEHHPRLMFIDVVMPGLSGFDVCRTLKRDPATSDIKVVILTAKDEEEDRRQGAAAGADDYFVKPFSPIALLKKTEEVLGS